MKGSNRCGRPARRPAAHERGSPRLALSSTHKPRARVIASEPTPISMSDIDDQYLGLCGVEAGSEAESDDSFVATLEKGLDAEAEAEAAAAKALDDARGAPAASLPRPSARVQSAPPVEAPTATSVLSRGVDARASAAEADGVGLRAKRKAEVCELRKHRRRGAELAPSRTREGFCIANGKWEGCLVDAVYNAALAKLVALNREAELGVSLARLRRACIPELGNVRQATWQSCMDALVTFNVPFLLVEATARFLTGPPMQLLLKAAPAVFVVGLCVTVGGNKYDHCIVVSTHPSEHAPLGKLINNYGVPVYIEACDFAHKVPAKKAFKKLIAQKIGHDDFSVFPTDIYELVQTLPTPTHHRPPPCVATA